MMKQIPALFVLLASTAIASAEPQRYLCSYGLRSTYHLEFLSNQAVIEIDPRAGTASAYDANIHYVHQRPISVRLSKTRDGDYRLRWRLKLPAEKTIKYTDGSTSRTNIKLVVRYTFTLFEGTKAGYLSARGGGQGFKPSRRMHCELSDEKLIYQKAPPPA